MAEVHGLLSASVDTVHQLLQQEVLVHHQHQLVLAAPVVAPAPAPAADVAEHLPVDDLLPTACYPLLAMTLQKIKVNIYLFIYLFIYYYYYYYYYY